MDNVVAVHDLERDLRSTDAQVIVQDRSVGRVLSRRLLGRKRRIQKHVPSDARRHRWLE